MQRFRARSVADQVYSEMRQAIVKNELLPGTPLPLSKLAHDMAVSQTPVREALLRLQNDGLIDYRPGRTACVSCVSEEDVKHIYNVRLLLEPYVYAVVANNVTRKEEIAQRLKYLHQTLQEVQDALAGSAVTDEAYQLYLESGEELDDIVAHGIESVVLRNLVARISDDSQRIRLWPETKSPDRDINTMRRAVQEHSVIVASLLSGDGVAVRGAVTEHLTNAMKRVSAASTGVVKIEGEQVR